MKGIVFLVKTFPTISETFVIKNVEAAIDKGFSVKIITHKKQSIEQSTQPEIISKHNLLGLTQEYYEAQGKIYRKLVSIIYLINPVLLLYFIKYLRFSATKNLSLLFNLIFYKKYRNYEIFHVHFGTAASILLDLKAIGYIKSKVIISFHGYDAHLMFKTPNQVQLFNKNVDKIITNSNYLKNILVQKGIFKNLIEVIPIGYDRNIFKTNKPKQPITKPLKLITVGRLETIKGHYFSIKAINELIQKSYNIVYTIVGDGSLFKGLQDLCEELGISPNITFKGSLNQSQIKQELENYDIFIMPSTIDEYGKREAFGVVSLEAQAMGLPVIGFHSGGFPETIIDNKSGKLVEDQNIRALAEAVEQLIHNQDSYIKMSEEAINNTRENFSFEKTTGRLLNLYNDLLEEK